MNNFTFSRIPELVFGAGKFSLLPDLISKYGKQVLLVTGENSFAKTSQSSILFDYFEKNGCRWSVVKITGEPSAKEIDSVSNKFRDELPDVVVAIGGGSVIDAGKAISAMLVSPEKIEYYLEGVGNNTSPGNKVPFIAVPTTAGTGSEATKNAVISKIGTDGYKSSLRHLNYIPDIALIDPELHLSCPKLLTACSGMDAFTQLLESYLSTQANAMTDALALDGIRNVKHSLVKLVTEIPDDVNLRAKMAYATWLSGITLANAGLGTIHGFAGAIGAMFDIPHGVVCGTLMSATNRATLLRLNDCANQEVFIRKYAAVGRIFIGEKNKPDSYFAWGLIDALDEMTEKLGIPTLSNYGVKLKDCPIIALKTSNKNNPVKLTEEELTNIVRQRID